MSASTLRAIIESASADNGMALKDLTVLAAYRDPYRLDTASNHAIGKWLADSYNQVCRDGSKLHARGLHYRLIGQVTKPDGKPYHNDDETWSWMSEKAVKAARYLKYLSWDALRDARNSQPEWYEEQFNHPFWQIVTDDVYLSLPDTLTPRLVLNGNLYRQPWQQVVIAEKQGVGDLLRPICRSRKASLVLPSGELSDQLMFDILKRAAMDGRPLAIHQLGDFDSSGHQMAVSTARTAQAIRDSQFPELEVRVHAVALTLEQCQEWRLPSTPLKETERRADRWQSAMGWAQTELDAAVALAPDKFKRVVRESLDQYFDAEIEGQARHWQFEMEREANDRLTTMLGPDVIGRIHYQTERKLAELDNLVKEVNQALMIDPAEAGISIPDQPQVVIGNWQATKAALLDTADTWVSNTLRLIARKAYREECNSD